MRSYTFTILLLTLLVGAVPQAFGQAPVPGSCNSGRAEADLDVNNVLGRVFNTGSLFYGNATTSGDGYLVPQASGNSPIFASGIWIGGQVDGELRIAGATYGDFEFWPGPLNDDGTLPDLQCLGADGIDFDKIWRVSRNDILSFEGGNAASSDLASWPVSIGAPVIAAPDNGFDDDGDGLTDEGTDGIDNDGDGNIDERDEQERVDVAIREAAGRPVYDLAGGDRPEIIGDQAVWWVMNDLGNTHANSNTPPIGVEVQVLAWAFARADALNDVTFYRYRVTKKTAGDLEDTYLTIFSDPDLGDAGDDFVGVDTTLSLGYVYNATNEDATYGTPPPATGYDFFQGPIVDLDGDGESTDTLGATSFMYFINSVGAPLTDPANGEEIYQTMQGRWTDGTPLTVGGNGYQTGGPVTTFAFPGDPVAGTGWNETSAGLDPDDRRFLVTTGPFTLRSGVPQDIVYGIVYARGADYLDSITQLRLADETAQTAYDIDFELASAPPPPPRCNPNSNNPELRPGSGGCLEAVETDESAALVWGYPSNSPNYLGRYEQFDRLLGGTGVPDSTYNFQAFNIYRYPNSNFSNDERSLLATYDIRDGVTTVIDTTFDAATSQFVPFVAFVGSDSGIEYSFDLTGLGLTNYTDYYFGITATGYSPRSIPKVIESSATTITVRPSNLQAGNGGAIASADVGQLLQGNRVIGTGDAGIAARVVDPTQITGSVYRVEFFEFDTDDSDDEDNETTFRITRDGETVFDGQNVFQTVTTAVDSTNILIGVEDQRIVVDGIEFFRVNPVEIPSQFSTTDGGNPGFAGGGFGIVEVANPTGPVCPFGSNDRGCVFSDYLDGNSVWLSPDAEDDYVLTQRDNEIGGAFGIGGSIVAAEGEDFEIRFTEACASGSCLGVYPSALPNGDDTIVSVPFELWNVRNASSGIESDDVRMIPLLSIPDDGMALSSWANNFPTSQDVVVRRVNASGIVVPDTVELAVTHGVSGVMPDRADGYALFAAAAANFGGAGATYDPANDGDTQEDINPANDQACRNQGYYADFCWRGANPRFVLPIGGIFGVEFADLAGDGTTPAAGTTIRFETTPKPDIVLGDVVEFNTADIAFETDNADAAQAAIDLIGIVPNPYLGVSDYETNNFDRVARFTNLPQLATIRIYTVSGTLIRTLQKEGPSRSLDWDLNTHNNLPVASGMYLIHVDVPGVGEKVLKFGVVNRKNRITIF